jgi:hypothetical protein
MEMDIWTLPTATLKLFLASGDPKRLRTAELSNWTGKAVAAPRVDFDAVLKREESASTGIYFLTGVNAETGDSAVYIGEAECIRDRVKSHLGKDFWNHIVFFVTKDENLTKAHVKYLEDRFIDIGREIQRAEVMNSVGSGARLPESDREDMEVFLEKMLQVLPVIGVDAFVDVGSRATRADETLLLTCSIKGLTATGSLTPGGFVVFAGSEAVLAERGSAANYPSVLVQRNKLIADKVLIPTDSAYQFAKDVEFSSPSAAATVIHGGSANGLLAWVNAAGVSLKKLEDT